MVEVSSSKGGRASVRMMRYSSIPLAAVSLVVSAQATAASGACMPTKPENPSFPGEHPGYGPYDTEEGQTPGFLGKVIPDLLGELRESDQVTNGLPIGLGAGNRHCFPESVPQLNFGNDD